MREGQELYTLLLCVSKRANGHKLVMCKTRLKMRGGFLNFQAE